MPGFRVPNLASRVLGLSAKRLLSDMEALRGHLVLLAETFVDPALFAGTCYFLHMPQASRHHAAR